MDWINRALRTLVVGVFLVLSFVGGAAYAEDPPPEQGQPPSAPTEVMVSGIGEDIANVAWTPVGDATQYTVWVDGNRWTGTTTAGAVLRGLQPYTEYTVYITASNAYGESGASSSVTFTTLPPVPSAPVVSVKSARADGAVIEWAALPSWQYIEAYRVYVDGQVVADIEAHDGLHQADLQNLAEGSHRVSVAGVNANREGPQSEPVVLTVRTISTPTGVTVANRGNDWVVLMWDNHLDAVKYKITVNGEIIDETAATAYQITGLEAGTAYTLGVIAVASDGIESLPATVDVATTCWPETTNLNAIMDAVYGYIPDVMPGVIVLFAIGAALKIARSGKYALGARRF